jgi:hypothetical protein
MKFLYSCSAPAKSALDDLYEQVKAEVSHGNDLYLGLAPFFNGIGQVVGESASSCEYNLIAERDVRTFNEKLAEYTAQGWYPHMSVVVWQGYFILWMAREVEDTYQLIVTAAGVEGERGRSMVAVDSEYPSLSSAPLPSSIGKNSM